MCGIAGYMGSFDPELLSRMNDLIAHRGPDSAGEWRDTSAGVGLAHRRLSIIDLSPAGAQPMWDVGRRAVIVFNGEIYNHRKCRPGWSGTGSPRRALIGIKPPPVTGRRSPGVLDKPVERRAFKPFAGAFL